MVAENKDSSAGTQRAIDATVWSVCDILRRSNCASAIQYVPELTWILFLRILDERERREAEDANAVGDLYFESLESPYRWRDWAAPGAKLRDELFNSGSNKFFAFVNGY